MGGSRRGATLASSLEKIALHGKGMETGRGFALAQVVCVCAGKEGKITRAGLSIWLWRPSRGNTWGRIP